jgi:hypothetical protein
MKTKKSTLRIEALEDRNMLSASPLGSVAAPGPSVGMLDSGRVGVSAPAGTGTYMKYELENVIVSGATGDPAPKVVLRWEKIAVPVVEEAASGGIVSEGQGYGIIHGGSSAAGKVQQQDIHFLRDGSTPADGSAKRRVVLVVLEAAPQDGGSAHAIDAVFIGVGGATEGQKTAGYDLKMAKKV